MKAELPPLEAELRRHDRERFLTALFAPAGAREALMALYGFNLEVARVRESVREPMLGQIRLQWWREGIEEAYLGTARQRHELLSILGPTIKSQGLSRSHFDRLIDARELDLAPEPPADMAALEAYCRDTAASLVWLALEILDAATPPARKAGEHIGIAYALTGLVRAIPFQARAGKVFLSKDQEHPAPEYLAEIAALAERHLAEARALRREVPSAALPALLQAGIAAHHLKRLRHSGYDAFDRRMLAPDGMLAGRLGLAALMRRY